MIMLKRVCFSFLDESPRWLIAKGRYVEATKIIERMAAVNGTQMPENMTFSGEEQQLKEKDLSGEEKQAEVIRYDKKLFSPITNNSSRTTLSTQ